MDIQKLNKEARLQEWAEMVSACRNSGQTVGEWCKENGISVKTYYYRLKKVCDAAGNGLLRRNSAVPVPTERNPEFAEISSVIHEHSCTAAVTVQIRGTEIQIHNGADAAVIETTLRILQSIC